MGGDDLFFNFCSAGREAVTATFHRHGECVGGLQGVEMLLGACAGLRKVGDVVPPPGVPPLALRRAQETAK